MAIIIVYHLPATIASAFQEVLTLFLFAVSQGYAESVLFLRAQTQVPQGNILQAASGIQRDRSILGVKRPIHRKSFLVGEE